MLPVLAQTTEGTEFPYTLAGVPVHQTSLGAPYALDDAGFGVTFGNWRVDLGEEKENEFQWVTQCYPTVVSNPVSCSTMGNVTLNGNSLTVDAGNCSITTPIIGTDPETQGATTAGACTSGLKIGKATIVMGSVNGHARKLAALMFDSGFLNQSSQNWYAVACSVDIAPSIAFRLQNYSRTDRERIPFGSDLVSDTATYMIMEGYPAVCDPHIPLSEVLTDAVLATGAASSFGLLTERRYNDGWWPTLYTVAYYFGLDGGFNGDNGPAIAEYGTFAFSNSKTALEDALGLANAIGLGMFWGTGPGGPNPNGTSSVSGLRVGPGQWWGIVYILPSMYALVVLLWLLSGVKK